MTDNSSDGITNFILTAISRQIASIDTSNMATITAISEDKKLIDVTIDTSKEELPDIPFMTLQGGGDHLQFPISVGDKCLIIFAKDSVEDWLGGEEDLVYSSDFNINNGFALVGINNSLSSIEIKDYVDFKVSKKIKIYNDSEDMISLLSDTIDLLSNLTNQLAGAQVQSDGGAPLPLLIQASLVTLKGQIDTVKTKFDTFKV